MVEEWRPVKGYAGLYEISSEGRVASHRRQPTRLLTAFSSLGYPAVGISIAGIKRVAFVHTLICEAWFGTRPEGFVCRHLDGDPTNSVLSNLAWGTPAENTQDLLRHGRHHQVAKTHCAQGHPYDEANTYYAPGRGAHRICRICNRAAVARYKLKQGDME